MCHLKPDPLSFRRDKSMRPVCCCFVLLALLTTLSLAALSASAQKEGRELWQIRAQNITNDLLKDAADLSSMQRAVLWVKLGQRWWRDDPQRARNWIKNAIEVVEQ